MVKYFPHLKKETEHFAELIAKLGAKDIRNLQEREKAQLRLDVVETNFDEIAKAIETLV